MAEFPFSSARIVWERYGWMWWALGRASNQGRAEVPVLTSNSSITGLVTSKWWFGCPDLHQLSWRHTYAGTAALASKETDQRLTYAWLACCSCVHVWSTGDSPPLGCESSLWQPHQDPHPEYTGWWSRGWRDEEGLRSLPHRWWQQPDLEGHTEIISLSNFSAV